MANIILAEDDDAMRQFLTSALENAGHKVTPCADGEEAYKALKTTPNTDLLLTDIVMPGMDGIELSQKANRLHPSLKVMFITGFAAIAMDEIDKIGTAQVMSKPFHLKELVNEVDKVLAA